MDKENTQQQEEIIIPQIEDIPAEFDAPVFEIKNNIYDLIKVDMVEFSRDEHKWNELYSKIEKLPPLLQEIFVNSDTEFAMMDTKNNFDLTENQVAELSRIIRQMIILDTPLNEVINLIQEKLKIDKENSKKIINFILSNILSSEAFAGLKQMNMEKFGKPQEKTAVPPAENIPPAPDAPTEEKSEQIKENSQNLVNLRGNQNIDNQNNKN